MKFSTAATFALAAAGVNAFTPAFKPAAKAISSSSLNGIFYLDDVYVPTESPDDLPPGAIPAMSPPSEISEGQVRALFYLWNDALATGDSRIVAKRYSEDPLLLPTVSDTPRTDYDTIKEYFDNFLKLEPQGVILDGHITIGNGWARDGGKIIYELSLDASRLSSSPLNPCRSNLPIQLFRNLRVHDGRGWQQSPGSIHVHLRLRKRSVEDLPPPLVGHA